MKHQPRGFRKMVKFLLRKVGRWVPNVRYLRAIPNRILKPLHKALGIGGGIVDVLGFKMKLEPNECVDGWLWFSPHLYDRVEIDFLRKVFPDDGVFLDVGANIGFWSLRFAHAFPQAQICAIEANPMTFEVLKQNVEINHFRNILALHCGVADEFGELPLYCNLTGNRGGDSFASYANKRASCVMVSVAPLFNVLQSAGIEKIDVMKIDIESFEERVLRKFFTDAPQSLWPRFICAEVLHVPGVVALLNQIGYRQCLVTRENAIFKL